MHQCIKYISSIYPINIQYLQRHEFIKPPKAKWQFFKVDCFYINIREEIQKQTTRDTGLKTQTGLNCSIRKTDWRK